jgi:hypothetical protein
MKMGALPCGAAKTMGIPAFVLTDAWRGLCVSGRLWGLQGALLDLPWNELPPEMK